ncbi:hypothetical protein SAMN05660350_00236 [Geodermatophilus obscurus]|uniref:Uncharacterized protein n=1 Tax=Geodermatophilus obscurus TaxID=1861 RepID=A0A1M7RXL2_9ACTN|nr:hypothetical protein SAMN05660350_00236 [Geodermatophilus obscurus]
MVPFIYRRGEDDLRRAPSLPHPRHQPDQLLLLGHVVRWPTPAEVEESYATEAAGSA